MVVFSHGVAVGFVLGLVVGLMVGIAASRVRRPHHADLDTLTGIPTRRAAEDALQSLHRGDAVVILDLDTLKATNDQFGHGAGDALLASVASHIASHVRGGDTVARWGGDEFVIVLRGGGPAAGEVVERLRLSSPATFSAGIAVHAGGVGAATLASADEALLEAKRAGGGRVVLR